MPFFIVAPFALAIGILKKEKLASNERSVMAEICRGKKLPAVGTRKRVASAESYIDNTIFDRPNK